MLVFGFVYKSEAQSKDSKKADFVRVYNMQGKKIAKGKILSIADAFLVLKSNKSSKIALSDIGYIKTKRSAGNNVLTGATVTAAFGAVLGASTANPDAWIFGYTAGEGAAMGIIGGAFLGSAVGGITAIFKNSKTYIINGDRTNWEAFKVIMAGSNN